MLARWRAWEEIGSRAAATEEDAGVGGDHESHEAKDPEHGLGKGEAERKNVIKVHGHEGNVDVEVDEGQDETGDDDVTFVFGGLEDERAHMHLDGPLRPVVCAMALLPPSARAFAPTPLRSLMDKGGDLQEIYPDCAECDRTRALSAVSVTNYDEMRSLARVVHAYAQALMAPKSTSTSTSTNQPHPSHDEGGVVQKSPDPDVDPGEGSSPEDHFYPELRSHVGLASAALESLVMIYDGLAPGPADLDHDEEIIEDMVAGLERETEERRARIEPSSPLGVDDASEAADSEFSEV